MRIELIGLGFALALSLASAASAHDFFLLPERFNDDGNGPVAIQTTVGSSFPMPEAVVTISPGLEPSRTPANGKRKSRAVCTQVSSSLDRCAATMPSANTGSVSRKYSVRRS